MCTRSQKLGVIAGTKNTTEVLTACVVRSEEFDPFVSYS